jgi:four helix bundle protein
MDALKELTVWNRSCDLCIATHRLFAGCNDHAFRDQITRATLAVPSKIAEGYERKSDPQYAQYLQFAKGSCAEARTQLYIAAEIGLIDICNSSRLMQESLEISKMLQALINRCENSQNDD